MSETELFYELFRYSHRPGKLLDTLAQPFPSAHAYVERITDTLNIARSNGDTAQAKTICALCDCALSALPPRDKTTSYDIQFKNVVSKRILRRMFDTTQAYLNSQTNGKASKTEYDLRDMNSLPAMMHPDVKTFIEVQAKLPPKQKKKS